MTDRQGRLGGRSPLQQRPENSALVGGARRRQVCRARAQQVPIDVNDEMFAGNYKEKMLSEADEGHSDDDPDRSGEFAELLHASTSQRRCTLSRSSVVAFEPNRRLTTRLSLAPAQRIGANGSVIPAKPRQCGPVAGRKSPNREKRPKDIELSAPRVAAPAELLQASVSDRASAKQEPEDSIDVFGAPPSTASAPSVSSESIDLLSIAECAMPDIGVEWDCLVNSFGIMDKDEIRDRLLKSGKIDVWVAKARQQREYFMATMRQAQVRVNEQWQKVGSLELACAELEVLKSRCASLQRDNESQVKTHTRQGEKKDLELEEMTQLAETRGQELTIAKAALQTAQATLVTVEARAAECAANAAAAAEQHIKSLQKMRAEKEQDSAAAALKIREISDLLSVKQKEAALANELTEEMENHINNLKTSNAQSRQAFADTQASYEDKIEHYELDKAQAATTIADMTEDMAALRAENTKLSAMHKQYDDEIVPGLKEECAQSRSLVDKLELSSTKLAAELKATCTDRDQNLAQTTMLKARLQDTTQLAEVMQTKVRELEADRDVANKAAHEQLQVTVELKAKSQQLSASVDLAHAEKKKLQDELDKTKSLYIGLESQMECINREMAGMESQIDRLKAEKYSEAAKAIAMAEQFEPLKEMTNKFESANQTLTDENSRLMIKVNILEGNCSDTDREHIANACDAEFKRQQQTEMSQELMQLRSQLKACRVELQHQQDIIVKGESVRRKMHNAICELKGNIRVFCRVRPMLSHDASEASMSDIVSFPTSSVDDKEAIELALDKGKDKAVKQQFSFDKVFPGHTTQEEIFAEVSSLVQSALDGYKVCIFAYGQTGSGKTHTMTGQGVGEDRGIIPRSLEMIVAETERLKRQGWSYSLFGSFLEIHNENLRDLLADPASVQELSIKHDTASGNAIVTNAVEVPVCANAEDIRMLMHKAAAQRSVGFTKMNAQSSRSHAVFRLRLEGSKDGELSLSGVVNLIDLAGSERLKGSHATGERLKETQAINKSLSALGDVFAALVAGASHVPFRNSKLTYLLQPYLGGNSKTLMMANLSPAVSSSSESLCSLRFASRVNKCELGRAKRQVRAPSITQDADDESSRHGQEKRAVASSSHAPGTRQRTRRAAAMANQVRSNTSRATVGKRRRMN